MHPMFSEPLKFHENKINVLTVENPDLFCSMVDDLIEQSEGRNGKFVLSENFEELDCEENLHVIIDFFHLEPNDRKLQNKITAKIKETMFDDMSAETLEINRILSEYSAKLLSKIDISLVVDTTVDMYAVLKSLGIELEFNDLTPMERVVEYFSVYDEFFDNQCFVLVNTKCFFGEAELKKLYHMINLKKHKVVLVEQFSRENINKNESHMVIDEQLCELKLD